MNLLFIQGGSRWKFDIEGNIYTDSNFDEHIWSRYRNYCNQLTVILRKEEKIYATKEAKEKFNFFDKKKMKYCSLPDIYRPMIKFINIKKRSEIKRVIESEVKKADRIIIRSLGNIYTNTALRYARKYNKLYLVEVTGFVYEGLWYHSLKGKLIARIRENQYKKLMRDVPYAVYVTKEALQKRYPSNGKILGCSDVELLEISDNILKEKINKLKNIDKSKKIVLGTAAFLDVGWKGQKYVLKAISKLKKMGFDYFEYQMIGAGTGKKIIKMARKMGIENEIKIIGTIPHDKVFNWFDNIDIYIQPSLQEGLCRSIIEAMSRACPVICSDVGGNYELIDKNYMFQKRNVNKLIKILISININDLIGQSVHNYKKSCDYVANILNKKRDRFYLDFIKESEV